VIAPTAVQATVSDVLGALEDRIAAHHELIDECERLHQWLLPELLSGATDL
jgi:hypothetical protein